MNITIKPPDLTKGKNEVTIKEAIIFLSKKRYIDKIKTKPNKISVMPDKTITKYKGVKNKKKITLTGFFLLNFLATKYVKYAENTLRTILKIFIPIKPN
ncbi:MAG: hypothetical protein ISS23_00985 [Nanoarchaeota archaeon]|nr:hypothetical protein [Nanoarchaeota archaeon]